MTTDCPICQETVKAFVTFECSHKLCLECYHKCIEHSHKKCSLCRAEISEMTDIVYHIEDLKEEIVNLDNELDEIKEREDYLKKKVYFQKKAIEELNQQKELLEYRIDGGEGIDDVEAYNMINF